MPTFGKISILLSLIAFSCNNQPPKDKYDAIAEDLCICMRPMMELQKEMMEVLSGGDETAMSALMEKAQKINSEGEACVEALEKKHGKIEGQEDEAKAMEALRKACPDIVEAMEQSAPPDMMQDAEFPMEEMPEGSSEE